MAVPQNDDINLQIIFNKEFAMLYDLIMEHHQHAQDLNKPLLIVMGESPYSKHSLIGEIFVAMLGNKININQLNLAMDDATKTVYSNREFELDETSNRCISSYHPYKISALNQEIFIHYNDVGDEKYFNHLTAGDP